MGNTAKKLLIAAMLSAVMALGTEFWYRQGMRELSSNTNDKPIATLVTAINEVQRKPIKRVIWQGLHENDALYMGEAIRTSSSAEATIKFIDSATIIELEPDSLVILEKSDKGLQLDFLKGNLFVRADESEGKEASSEITLKSGKREINLKNAELSVAKSEDADDKINLQVFKGQAEVSSDGKKILLDKDKSGTISDEGLQKQSVRLETLFPRQRKIVYVDPKQGSVISFKWKPISSEYQISLEAGENRKNMEPVNVAVVSGEVGELKAKVPAGRLYWRLKATKKGTNEEPAFSNVIKNKIIAKLPPVPLTPEKGKIVLLEDAPEIEFSWANPANLKDIVLEIATDPGLSDRKVIDAGGELGGNNRVILDKSQFPKSGSYYWRVTGYLGVKREPLSSDIDSFEVRKELKINPPTLIAPEPSIKISIEEVRDTGLFLSWNPSPGASDYLVTYQRTPFPVRTKDGSIKKRPPEKEVIGEVNIPQFKILKIEPGRYTWSVKSKSSKGKVSAPTETRKFTVRNLPKLKWADGKRKSIYQYNSLKPQAKIAWERGPSSVERYRIRVSQVDGEKGEWVTVSGLNWKGEVPSDGMYKVDLEGLDKELKVVSKARSKQLTIQPVPLLPPPIYSKDMPETLLAQKNGSFKVNWEPVEGATHYVLSLQDSNGQLVKELKFRSSVGVIKGLLPGNYNVSVRTVDKFGRESKNSDSKVVEVPKQSSIRAPKIKTIKVK